MSEITERLRDVVALMVDRPDEVEVDEIEGRDGVQLELRVDDDDLGKVIGRQGRTARALRCVLGAHEARGGERYGLEILD